MKLANIDLKGLNTYASHRSVQENYLLDCNNVVCDKAGVISTRRGFSFFNDVLVSCKKIFSAIQNIFVHADSKLYYDGGGTFTQVTFPNTSTIDANDSTQKIQIEDQNKALYFNGKRVSSEANNPIDKKIKKLSAVSSNVINAGLEAPINLSLVPTASGIFAANESIAVRVFYQYTDENNYTVTSPVSDRVVGINDTGGTANFVLSFQIPVQFIDRPVNIYYAVSNVTTSPVVPDDNLFWGENTIIESGVNVNVGISSVFTLSQIIKRDSIVDPVDLYTNSQQQGILQNNDPPVCSIDLETYQGYTFYANPIDRLIKRLFALEVPVDETAIVLDGITYTRKVSSNYSSYQYSGSNTFYSTLDLCRCVTATQTKYRLVVEQEAGSPAESWQQKSVLPKIDNPSAPARSDYSQATTAGDKIYILQTYYAVFTTQTIQVYNTITSSFETAINMPAKRFQATINHVNGKLYIIGGDANGFGSGAAPATLIYDIAGNSWTTGAAYPYADGNSQTMGMNMASCVYNNNIYFFGGWNGDTAISVSYNDRVYKYDPSLNSWTLLTNMTAAKYNSVAVINGAYAYVVGGFTTTTSLTATNYRYDFAGNSWSTMTAITAARGGGGAAVDSGNIYYYGGAPSVDGSGFIAAGSTTMYAYSIAGNSWTTSTESLIEAVFNIASVKSGNSMYAFGGLRSSTGAGQTYATMSEKYQFGGVYVRLEERFIGEETDISYTSSYISNVNFDGSTSSVYRFEQKNTVQFSKQGQPEAVPFFNNFQCGSASYDILRLSALRSSLMILKTDGIYQLNGVSPETFSVQQLDPTFVLIAPQSLAKLNNEIYCLTNKGVVAINESGAKIISYPIKDLIDYDVAQVANLKTDINGTAYEDDYRYILTINDKTYTYNYVSDQWTIWFSGKSDIASWTVFNSNLYYLDSTRAYRERKTLTSADFQDENNAGIDASIKFNNLELNPGNMMDVIAMQILQRTQSNLTASITPDNNFNSGTLFTQLLDKYVVRVMFPNECRKAFYFRPLIEWNTEVAATPGTFSDLQLEGLDFDYDETASNIK